MAGFEASLIENPCTVDKLVITQHGTLTLHILGYKYVYCISSITYTAVAQ